VPSAPDAEHIRTDARNIGADQREHPRGPTGTCERIVTICVPAARTSALPSRLRRSELPAMKFTPDRSLSTPGRRSWTSGTLANNTAENSKKDPEPADDRTRRGTTGSGKPAAAA